MRLNIMSSLIPDATKPIDYKTLLGPIDYTKLLGSTLFSTGFVESESERLRKRLDALEKDIATLKSKPATKDTKIDERDAKLVALTSQVGSVRSDLSNFENRVRTSVREAQETLSAVVPDAAQLAYLKVAKVDATEIRSLINKSHRNRSQAENV